MDYFERRRQEIYGTNFNDNYMDNIFLDEMYDNDVDFVDEGLGDIVSSIKEKINAAITKIKELWQKFKAWITNLAGVIMRMFMSGEKLVQKYESQLREEYQRKKDVIKFNGHIYNLNGINDLEDLGSELEVAFNELKDSFGASSAKEDISNKDDSSTDISDDEMTELLTDGECKKKSEVAKWAASSVRDAEKGNHKLGDIDVNVFIDFLANGKKSIKALKKIEKDFDKLFKECISELNSLKSDYSDNKAGLKIIKGYVSICKKSSSLVSMIIKTIIKELKDGLRLYTGLARKLLDARIKGKDGAAEDDVVPEDEGQKALPEPSKIRNKQEAVKKQIGGGNSKKDDDDVERITPDPDDIIDADEWERRQKAKGKGKSYKDGAIDVDEIKGGAPSTKVKRPGQKAIGQNLPSTKVKRPGQKAIGQNYVAQSKKKYKK